MFFLTLPVQQPAPQGDHFAVSFAAGRDLNGDQIPDLVIGDATPLVGAEVWFVSGRDWSVLSRHAIKDAPLGVSVDLIGDIDRDGSPDVAVCGRAYAQPGSAEIVSGRSGSTLREIRGQEFGLRECIVRAAGDVDGDGCPDLIIVGSRALKVSTASSVLVVSGLKGSVIWSVEDEAQWGIRYSASTKISTAAVGDVDADGRNDIVVCWKHDKPRSGRVVLYSGRTGLPLREFSGTESELDFGYSLDSGVDFDGDLRPDILIGSPDFYPRSGVRARGRVRVFSGRDGSLLRMLDGTDFPRPDVMSEADHFGECARFVRDTNRDGFPEILVGSPEEGLLEGSAYLCSGKSGSILLAIEGWATIEAGLVGGDRYFGRELAAGGDIDRDGVEDFVVGDHPCVRAETGLVRVFSGKTGYPLRSIDRKSLLGPMAPPSTPR